MNNGEKPDVKQDIILLVNWLFIGYIILVHQKSLRGGVLMEDYVGKKKLFGLLNDLY